MGALAVAPAPVTAQFIYELFEAGRGADLEDRRKMAVELGKPVQAISAHYGQWSVRKQAQQAAQESVQGAPAPDEAPTPAPPPPAVLVAPEPAQSTEPEEPQESLPEVGQICQGSVARVRPDAVLVDLVDYLRGRLFLRGKVRPTEAIPGQPMVKRLDVHFEEGNLVNVKVLAVDRYPDGNPRLDLSISQAPACDEEPLWLTMARLEAEAKTEEPVIARGAQVAAALMAPEEGESLPADPQVEEPAPGDLMYLAEKELVIPLAELPSWIPVPKPPLGEIKQLPPVPGSVSLCSNCIKRDVCAVGLVGHYSDQVTLEAAGLPDPLKDMHVKFDIRPVIECSKYLWEGR